MKSEWKEGLPELKPGHFYFIRERGCLYPVYWENFVALVCLKDKDGRPRLFDDELNDQTDMIEWECPEVYEYCEVEL